MARLFVLSSGCSLTVISSTDAVLFVVFVLRSENLYTYGFCSVHAELNTEKLRQRGGTVSRVSRYVASCL